MSVYKCNECGMSVSTSCGECNQPLVDGYLDLDDGTKVQISQCKHCLLYTSPSPRDKRQSRMPSSA